MELLSTHRCVIYAIFQYIRYDFKIQLMLKDILLYLCNVTDIFNFKLI